MLEYEGLRQSLMMKPREEVSRVLEDKTCSQEGKLGA